MWSFFTAKRSELHFTRVSKGAKNSPKIDPQLFFYRIYSSMNKLLSFQIFSLLCKGVQGKRHKNY